MKEVECIAKLLIIWEQSFENNQEIYLSVWKDGPLTYWDCDLDMISLSKTWTTFPPSSFQLHLCTPTDENKSLSSLLGRKRPPVTPGRPKRGQEARAGEDWIEFRKWGISSNSLESFPPRDITLYNSSDVQKQRKITSEVAYSVPGVQPPTFEQHSCLLEKIKKEVGLSGWGPSCGFPWGVPSSGRRILAPFLCQMHHTP